MGYEVSCRRIYGPKDLYCNGSGISVLCGTFAEAETTYEGFCKNDAGYPAAVFLFGLGMHVIKQSGPNLVDVERAQRAAWGRRQQQAGGALPVEG